MTIAITGGWAQWDYQLGTFRAEVDGVIYGLCTDDVMSPDDFPFALTDEEKTELSLEKTTWEANKNALSE